jgi:hypothetical protein
LSLICTFVFQFSIGSGQDQHQMPVLRKCRTLAVIVKRQLQIIKNLILTIWLEL